jgi:hypothetical protein
MAGAPPQNSKARTWAPSQWGSSWDGSASAYVWLDAPRNRHEELGLRDLAGERVGDRDGLAGEVDERLLARPVVVAQDEVEPSGEDRVLLGEPGVPESVGAAFPVLAPEQGLRHALAPELLMDLRPVGDRAGDGGRWRGRPAVQALLEIAVVDIGRQRPGEAGLGRLDDVPADGGAGQACRDACEGRAQSLGEAEPEGFSDLAHGSTGTGTGISPGAV